MAETQPHVQPVSRDCQLWFPSIFTRPQKPHVGEAWWMFANVRSLDPSSTALLPIEDDLRARFVRLKLGTHLLQPESQRFNLLLQLLHLAVLFEELIEQHCVHCFVAHRVWFSVSVAGHQGRIYLFYVLRHEAELRDAVGVKVMLVVKRDWFERENCFACLVHRLNRLLVTLRRDYRAEMTVGIYDDAYASCHGCATNAGDKRVRLSSLRADANMVGLARNTSVTNVDIVVTCCKR